MSQLIYKSETTIVSPSTSGIKVLGVTDRGTAVLVDLKSLYTDKIVRQSVTSTQITDDHLLTGSALRSFLNNNKVKGPQGPAGPVGEEGTVGPPGDPGPDRCMTIEEVIRILGNYGIQIDRAHQCIWIQCTTTPDLKINLANLQSVQAVHFYEGEPVVDQNVTENNSGGVGGNTGNGEVISPSGPNSGLL